MTARDSPRLQPPAPVLNTFRQPVQTPVLDNSTNLAGIPSSRQTTTSDTRSIPLRKNSQLSNGVGFNFRTMNNDSSSNTPYSHVVTSVDNTNAIGSQGLRVNDYILTINDENVEYLNHEQLEDKLRRINNSETIRLLVTDGEVYRAFKKTSDPIRMNPTPVVEPPKFQQNLRQYRLQRNPEFEGYGFRVRSNQQIDGTPHQIVSVEPDSPADIQGLRVGDYILRVNNQTVQHMSQAEFNHLMQNFVRNDTTRDGNLLLEVMDEDTYRAINHLPSFSKQYQPSADVSISEHHTQLTGLPNSSYNSISDETYPRMRQCFIRVRNFLSIEFNSLFVFVTSSLGLIIVSLVLLLFPHRILQVEVIKFINFVSIHQLLILMFVMVII